MTNMISPIERPLDWQRPSSSAAVRNGKGSSFFDSSSSFRAASSSPSRTMKPPPTEKNVAWCRISPPASETVNVIPLVCRGRMVSGRRTMSCTPYGSGTPFPSPAPASCRVPVSAIVASRPSTSSGRISSGWKPSRPSRIAVMVPCPCPVAASEPYRSTRSDATFVQVPGGFEFLGEDGGGPHGAHRVRTGRPYSDGKEVEDSNSHCRFLTRSCCGPAEGPAGRRCGRRLAARAAGCTTPGGGLWRRPGVVICHCFYFCNTSP